MKTLAVHHTAGNQNRPARDDWETGKRWYNHIIDGAGKLHTFKTTPNQRQCGLTYDLAFSGDFTRVDPTKAQVEAWNAFKATHKFDTITTHGELAKKGCATASACPGRLLNFIDISYTDPMDKLSDHIVDNMPADQRITELKSQVKRLQDIINSPTEGIAALTNKIKEQDELLDSKRKQIEELEKKVEDLQANNGLTPEQTADLVLLQEVKTVFSKLLQ